MDADVLAKLAGPEDLQRDMEIYFEHVGRWKRPVFYFEKAWKPLCDVSESGSELIVVVDLGGVSTDNIHIQVEGDTLLIRGIRREPKSAPRRRYHMMEISYGAFEREINLPARVDAEKGVATFSDGFLEIRLPKVRSAAREVDVDVSSG